MFNFKQTLTGILKHQTLSYKPFHHQQKSPVKTTPLVGVSFNTNSIEKLTPAPESQSLLGDVRVLKSSFAMVRFCNEPKMMPNCPNDISCAMRVDRSRFVVFFTIIPKTHEQLPAPKPQMRRETVTNHGVIHGEWDAR